MAEMSEIAQTEAVLKALHDSIGEQLKEVRAVMQQQMDATGASRVDAALPDGTKVATISATNPTPAAQVTDPDKFRTWVRDHSPANHVSRVVHEVRPAYQAALLAEMTAAGAAVWADRETGEVHDIPGVEIRPTRSRGHSVRPVDGGREAIAEAWRTGQLAHLVLPQITAGGAE